MSSNNKRVTMEEFIAKAIEVHGDKYNYNKVNYVNSKTKITITCNEHADFEQKPYNHLIGQGCPECGKLKSTEAKKNTQEEFITRSEIMHKSKYLYNKVNYLGTDTKVTITCPIHGDFQQTPHNHSKGVGCNECGRASTIKLRSSNSKENLLLKQS